MRSLTDDSSNSTNDNNHENNNVNIPKKKLCGARLTLKLI